MLDQPNTMTNTPRTDALQPYLDQGYYEISTDSGTGSRILVNDSLNKVVKLNEDLPYHGFAQYAIAHSDTHLPSMFTHEIFESETNAFSEYLFTVTVMELLLPLTPEESLGVIDWYKQWCSLDEESQHNEDPYQLLDSISALRKHAETNGYKLDLGKSTNYMIRDNEGNRELVITDPYN